MSSPTPPSWDGPPGAEIAEHGFAFLRKELARPDGAGGRGRSSRSGQVLGAPHLTSTISAFALFALAWYVRATGERQAAGLAHETRDFANQALWSAGPVGYLA